MSIENRELRLQLISLGIEIVTPNVTVIDNFRQISRIEAITSRSMVGLNSDQAANITVRLGNADLCFNEIACTVLGAECDVYVDNELFIRGFVERFNLNDDKVAMTVVE